MRRLIVTAIVPVFFMLLMSMPVVGQRGRPLVVDADGHGNATDCDASDPLLYRTIQAAVDSLGTAAADTPQRTIIVCPGTYTAATGMGAVVDLDKGNVDHLTIVAKHVPNPVRGKPDLRPIISGQFNG